MIIKIFSIIISTIFFSAISFSTVPNARPLPTKLDDFGMGTFKPE